MRFIYVFSILIGFTSTPALSQAQPQDSPSAFGQSRAAPIAQLEPKTENGITYVCGGVGMGSAARMKQAASKYDLMITFAASNGAYLADIGVDIADSRGQSMLKTTCNGPIMLVDMPKAGTYRIRAEAEGHTLTRTARVREGGKVRTVSLTWPVHSVDMGLIPNLRNAPSGGDESSPGNSGHAKSDPE